MTDDMDRRAELVEAARAALVDLFDRHERVFLAFSGGKDSLALAHLCEPWRDRLTLVWSNTGHMAPHMVDFVRGHRDRFDLVEVGPSRPMAEQWADPGEVLPPVVRQAVSVAIPAPATAEAAWAEHHYWAERAEVHALFDGPGLPLWVRARRAFLETRLDTLFTMLPADPAAHETWRQLAEGGTALAAEAEQLPTPSPPAAGAQEAEAAAPPPPAPLNSAPVANASLADGASAAAAEPEDPLVEKVTTGSDSEPSVDQVAHSPDPGTGSETVQSGQPTRTREEARAAVRALLGESLTDREIARRVGVSPSTVAAVRKASA